jgi:hypothetical protein
VADPIMTHQRPSFLKEILSVFWLMIKVTVPLTGWIFGCLWIGRHHLLVAEMAMSGGIMLGMAILFGWSNYQRKSQSLASQERSFESRESIRQLLDGASAGTEKRGLASLATGPPTRMPLDYLQPEPLKLSEVPAGEDVYISFAEVTVDLDGATWVDVEAKIQESAGLMNVKVRLVEGGYVLTFLKRKGLPLRFTPRRLFSVSSYAPVIQVLEEEIGKRSELDDGAGRAPESIPEVEIVQMAKLPEALVEKSKRKLKDLRAGERALFPLHALKIDEQRNAFLFVNTDLAPPTEANIEYGEIWVDDAGKYHIDLKATKRIWKPQDLTLFTMGSGQHLVPVETIAWSASPGPPTP